MLSAAKDSGRNHTANYCHGERHVVPALKKIRTQFLDNPEHNLFFAVVAQAIKDLSSPLIADRRSAQRYLKGEIPHAELCGVDSSWIRLVLRKCNIEI